MPSVAESLPVTVRRTQDLDWRADLLTPAVTSRGRTLAGAIGRLRRRLAERADDDLRVRVELSPAVVRELGRIAGLRHLPPGRRAQLIADLCRAHAFPVVDATWLLEALDSDAPPVLAESPSPAR